ncbi:glutaredoxin [Candidatus Marinamargulisbacteria bacterium SCGC AG-439-L15]|nr:glutaredoxin [Candidatus Marinamargulisbacteria bacterium SCGC AG-439-L15]
MSEYELKLYVSHGCIYCKRVTDFLEEHSLEIPMEEPFNDPKEFQSFMDLTGGTQVPCLMINGEPMRESEDIVVWIESKLL